MIIKKPYAFFIKYFKLINFILFVSFCYVFYKLTQISGVFGQMVSGNMSNYSSLSNTYIGFKMFLILFIIIILLLAIFLLLKVKKKPMRDYLFAILYTVILIIYLVFINSIFISLESILIEQTKLDLYSDMSFVFALPSLYFLIKFFLMSVGFNLKKFNFTNDIIELKREEKDDEEVEIIFNKNTYKYKRRIRKVFRELRYYYLENKGLILSIAIGIFVICFFSLIGFNIFKSNNKVKVGEMFVASNFNYVIDDSYETVKDINNKTIKKDSKFVIINLRVRNAINVSQSIDLKRIRLFYGDEFVYANVYYNKYFEDLGNVYNNEIIFGKDYSNYIIIFEVPTNYKSNKYTLKFYDKVIFEDDEIKGSYKEIIIKTNSLDKKLNKEEVNLNETVFLDKSNYKNSSIKISKYNVQSNYIYKVDTETKILQSNDINNKILILDYKLVLDQSVLLSDYKNKDFFNKFSSVEYIINDKVKKIKTIVIGEVDKKIMLEVPFELKDASSIKIVFSFRTKKIVYNLK